MSVITAAQKELVFGLLRKLSLPTDYVTGLHQAAFVSSSLWSPQTFGYYIGWRVDSVFDRMSQRQASMLINALKARLSE